MHVLNCNLSYFRTVNVSVPKKTRNNGTLYAYIFLHHAGVLPWHDGKQVHLVSPLTTYMVPKPEEVNLLTGESAAQVSIGSRLPAQRSRAAAGIHTRVPTPAACIQGQSDCRDPELCDDVGTRLSAESFPLGLQTFYVKSVT